MRGLFLFLAFCVGSLSADAQLDYYVTSNANLYLPEGAEGKGVYPILWYDKETKPKFLTGGFGVGFAAEKPLKEKLVLKGELNISRHLYWESIALVDGTGNRLGQGTSSTADYSLHLLPTLNYNLTRSLFVGSGLGVNVLIMSRSRVPEYQLGGKEPGKDFVTNNFYKTITIVVPVELSLRTERKLYAIRFEQSLGSRYKSELREYKKEHFGILSFSIGWRLNAVEKV